MIVCNYLAIGVVLCVGVYGLTTLILRKHQPQNTTSLNR